MRKEYLPTAARWIGTIAATVGTILLHSFLIIWSMFVKDNVSAEISWVDLIKCIALTIGEILAVYYLLRAKWYVRSFGEIVFRLYAAIHVVFAYFFIKCMISFFSPDVIVLCNNLATQIIAAVFSIIEYIAIPILFGVFTFFKERPKIKKDSPNT